ncbi:MAG: nodulation protein NfeD [Treponema sp.]|jgi:membrane-bound serine protease (ClpP class)|nr:nodulation protein NfeD [Treponema sp.]
MKFHRLFGLCLFFAAVAFPLFSQAPAEAGDGKTGAAWIIPIRGDIEPSLAAFVRREGGKAQAQGARYIIFEIDTFGGRVDSALQITSFITSIKNARTIAWVNSGGDSMGVSWSAGALIALACQDIYMAAGTSLGAAAPVTIGADGQSEGTGEKTVAAVRSQIAALAERNKHPVELARAMVDYDVEIWEVLVEGELKVLSLQELELMEKDAQTGGPEPQRRGVISPKGKLLSLTSGEAVRYGLARGLADDRESLLAAIGAPSPAVESVPGAADEIVSILTSAPVQALLIILGLVMIFLEINSPGFGIPGVTAIIAFVTVFGSGAMLGRVGSLEIVLFLLGLGLLVVEIFVTPGFGFMGISGFILIGLSLMLSMQDFVIPRFDWEWTMMGRNALVVFTGLLAAVTGIAVIVLLGPKIRLFNRLTLQTRLTGTAAGPLQPGDQGNAPEAAGAESYQSLVGKTGVAATTLHPVGRVEIDGEVYEAQAEGLFAEPGRGVRVIRVRGNNITVRLV